MFDILLTDQQAIIALSVVCMMLAGFISERYPPEVIAIAGAALFIVFGFVSAESLGAVFSNAAPLTIGCMFVMSGALVRTGMLERVARMAGGMARRRPARALAMLAVVILGASAFMNNTPVVIVLIPIVIQIARQIGVASTQLLMPLSYVAILGGTCTLIGTSTNLLVDGIARGSGMQPFGIFEIAPLGLIVAAIGITYLLIVGPWLLPKRPEAGDLAGGWLDQRFLSEIRVLEGSAHVGLTTAQVMEEIHASRLSVLRVHRGEEVIRRDLPDLVLEGNDRLIVAGPVGAVLQVRDEEGVDVGLARRIAPPDKPVIMEALVGPGRSMAGRRIDELHMQLRFGVRPLAVERHDVLPGTSLPATRLNVGDTLLLEGSEEALSALTRHFDIINLDKPRDRAFRPRKAPFAAAVLAGVVLLAALGVMPIVELAIIGVAIVLISRCLDADEAIASINGRILLLIFSMLAVGQGLQETGAVKLVVAQLAPLIGDLPPLALLAALYLLTWVLTELVTNNAVAVIMAPLAIALAQNAGLDPRPFVVAVMFAASASFATPIGYQTNTLVYSAGSYRFSDFVKVGVPLNLLVAAVTILAIPRFWPL